MVGFGLPTRLAGDAMLGIVVLNFIWYLYKILREEEDNVSRTETNSRDRM